MPINIACYSWDAKGAKIGQNSSVVHSKNPACYNAAAACDEKDSSIICIGNLSSRNT